MQRLFCSWHVRNGDAKHWNRVFGSQRALAFLQILSLAPLKAAVAAVVLHLLEIGCTNAYNSKDWDFDSSVVP